jgi:TrmH family RNA methyltransferase
MSASSAREPIRSRDNPLIVRLRKLRRDPSAYRRGGGLWLEGEHLCEAWAAGVGHADLALVRASAASRPAIARLAAQAAQGVEVDDAVFDTLSELESPAAIGYWVERPPAPALAPGVPTLVLDRLQDAGNAGTLLRSAAAMGFGQVVALAGTVALWAPKVLRAGMGAHFSLAVVEGLTPDDLPRLALPLLAAVPRAAAKLGEVDLPWPCAWVLGSEGQGVDDAVARWCALQLAIPQPGGVESLNVAAAGAICLYESARQRRRTAAPPGQ